MTENKNEISQKVSANTKKKNKALGLALLAFVLILGIVSYYKIASLTP